DLHPDCDRRLRDRTGICSTPPADYTAEGARGLDAGNRYRTPGCVITAGGELHPAPRTSDSDITTRVLCAVRLASRPAGHIGPHVRQATMSTAEVWTDMRPGGLVRGGVPGRFRSRKY